jgi:hypothetical protein
MKQDANISGRVLRVKSGYNPNSSSIGSDIPTFLAAAAAAGTATVIIINILAAARIRILDQQDNRDEEADE